MIAATGYGMLEYVFMSILGFMVVVIGIFSVAVVARVVEPRGMRVLLRRLAGKD